MTRPEVAGEPIELPMPTTWPMILALGVCGMAAGVVTNLAFSLLGLILFGTALGFWIKEIAEGAKEEIFPEAASAADHIKASRKRVEHLSRSSGLRAELPERVHPYSAGIKGGIVGGIAMAATALLYGVVARKGLWYPINLLAAMVIPRFNVATIPELEQFSMLGLGVAIVIHGIASMLTGLFYGMILPMLPGKAWFWGGVIAPLLWTGGLRGFLGIINPTLDKYVDWPWFVASQIVFGLVVGLVVSGTKKIPASQAGDVTSAPKATGGS